MFLAAISWGLGPSEFWDMTLPEWWLIYEERRPRDPLNDFAGRLTQGDVDELTDWMNAA